MARYECYDFKERLSIYLYYDNICENYNYHHILDLVCYPFYFILLPFKVFLFVHQICNSCLIFDAVYLQCQFVLLILKGKYSNLFIVAATSSKSFSGKTSLAVKNSYLLAFPDDKTEILAVCLSRSHWALFPSILLLIVLNFSVIRSS